MNDKLRCIFRLKKIILQSIKSHKELLVLGILLALTAGLGYGTSAVLARLGLVRIKPSTGTLISLVSSLTLVGTAAMMTDFDTIVSLPLKAFLWFGMIGVINYVLGRQFNFSAVRYIGAARATPIFSSSPLFAVVIAVLFVGESVNPYIVLGTLSIVSGLYLIIKS